MILRVNEMRSTRTNNTWKMMLLQVFPSLYNLLPIPVELLFCFHLSVCFSRSLVRTPCACGHQGNSSNLATHVPVDQGAIRGQSMSLSSCHKWCWWAGEGPRLCFEGQQGRSPALCQRLRPPRPDQTSKLHLWNEGCMQPHTDVAIVLVWVQILDVIVN